MTHTKNIMYGKEITTAEQQNLYDRYEYVEKTIKELEKEKLANFNTYDKMRGKYAIKENSEYLGMGHWSVSYDYPDEKTKVQENIERETYYAEKVAPFYDKIKKLNEEKDTLCEKICVALHGYGTKVYYAKEALREAEEELAHAIEVVDYHRQNVEKLREEVNK